jgi:DNA-binding winged helix-turn-helix (wHTH) protein
MTTAAPDDQNRRSFGPFTLDVTTRRLARDGVPVEIEPKPLGILLMLLAHPGQVVTFDEFKISLWADVTVEVTANLNTHINKLRKALGESRRKPLYILTKRGEGYYFNPEVTVTAQTLQDVTVEGKHRTSDFSDEVVSSAPLENTATKRKRVWMGRWMVASLACIGALVIVAAGLAVRLSPHREMSRLSLTGRVLTMLDQEGQQMWHFELPGNPPRLSRPDDYANARPVIADIDGDGRKEVLYAFGDVDNRQRLTSFTALRRPAEFAGLGRSAVKSRP